MMIEILLPGMRAVSAVFIETEVGFKLPNALLNLCPAKKQQLDLLKTIAWH